MRAVLPHIAWRQGVSVDFPPARLKQGFGEETCGVLNALAQNALKNKKWKWSKCVAGMRRGR